MVIIISKVMIAQIQLSTREHSQRRRLLTTFAREDLSPFHISKIRKPVFRISTDVVTPFCWKKGELLLLKNQLLFHLVLKDHIFYWITGVYYKTSFTNIQQVISPMNR